MTRVQKSSNGWREEHGLIVGMSDEQKDTGMGVQRNRRGSDGEDEKDDGDQ